MQHAQARSSEYTTPTAAFSSFSSTIKIVVQVSGVTSPVSEGSPLFAKTQYPVCPGPVLMKEAQSTVNVNDIHDCFNEIHSFIAYRPILPEPPIYPRSMKLSRHGLTISSVLCPLWLDMKFLMFGKGSHCTRTRTFKN